MRHEACMKDNICPMGVLEEESKWDHSEEIYEEIVAEKSPWGNCRTSKEKRKRPYNRCEKKTDYLQRNFWPQQKSRPGIL